MSSNDLLSSTLHWPGKGFYGLKSNFLQTTETNLLKQSVVSDHMKHHYRRLGSVKSAIDSKPPKSMLLSQKCRDRARKEMAQIEYTKNVIDQFSIDTNRKTPRSQATQSARTQRIVQSQPATFRARSGSTGSSRMITRSLNMNGSMQNLNQTTQNQNDIANKIFGDGVLSHALTTMAALGKMTSTERNKSSADVLDKHPDAFIQPEPSEHKPRLVKRDGDSFLRTNRSYYNPPRKPKAQKKPESDTKEAANDENKPKIDKKSALREQLNRSLEIRENLEKKIRQAKATTTTDQINRKQSDEVLKRFGLAENERLEYVRFMQEITDAIIRNHLTTESAIEKLFEIHIDRNQGKLNEKRLRDLLEALKEDLGVQSSRKQNAYASVQKATNFDSEPIPPEIPLTNREDSLILTPKAPNDERRRSSFDINEPLPWQSNEDIDIKPKVTKRITQEPKSNELSNTYKQNSLDDDYLFTPSSAIRTPKPRLSPPTDTNKNDDGDHYRSEDIPNTIRSEPESTIPLNLNSTIRQPMTELKNVDWLKDPEPTITTIQESPLHEVEEHHFEEREEHHFEEREEHDDDNHQSFQRRKSSTEFNDQDEPNTYGSHEFEDSMNSED